MHTTRPHALILVLTLLLGCDGDEPRTDAGDRADGARPEDLEGLRREVARDLAMGVILPTLREFARSAAALEEATGELAADPSLAANRDAAQQAWREAMRVWQRAEVMQIGPAGMGGTECPVVGGMDLRDEIYSWDSTSECRIDQETVEQTYTDPAMLAMELVNVRGLDAMEYLLFAEGGGNACSSLSPINADGTWAALGDAEVASRRAAYAHALAGLVRARAEALRDLWEPAEGGFADDLATAGQPGSAYPTTQRAFDDLGGAMLYLDTATRDMKLGEPAGIAGCMSETCFDALEHPHARFGLASILANLRGFQLLYLGEQPGTEGRGWDDVLVAVGAEALAAEFTAALEDAIAATEALGTDSLEDAVAADRAAVVAVYEAIGEVQRLFKVDVLTVLDIEPTTCRIGDND